MTPISGVGEEVGQERTPKGPARYRGISKGARRWSLRVGFCVALAVVMLLSNNSGVVAADANTPPTISVSGLHAQTISAGGTATVTANLSNGIPLSAVTGTFTGYLVFFFFGQTDPNGTLGYDKQFVAAPSSCTTPDLVCTSAAEVSFTHTYGHSGSFDASLTVYDAAGDYAIATEVINVVPPDLTVAATSDTLTAAEDAPIHFSANVTANPASFQSDGFAFEWQFGDNTSVWGNPVNHSYAESGGYVATVRAFDNTTGAANQSSVSGIVITNPAPTAGLVILTPTTTPNTFVENSTVQFSAGSSTDVASDIGQLRFSWQFGDGAEGAGFYASHVYTETGTFPVRLTVTDEGNLQSNTTTNVTITSPGPVPTASAAPLTVGNVALLNASGSTDVPVDVPSENYSWSSGVPLVTDMGSSYGVIGRDGYFAPGNYTAAVLATNSEGKTAGANVTVPVADAPPNVGVYSAYTLANISLVLSGTVGNTITVQVLASNHLVASGAVTRTTGAPKGNVFTLTGVPLSLADHDSIVVQLVDPPPAPYGSNPVNLSISFSGDSPCPPHVPRSSCSTLYYSFTFLPSKNPTAVWTIDASHASLGRLVFLKAQVFSPGRTALSTTWQFGDGATLVSTTPAPGSAQPTVGFLSAQHRWASGRSYTFTVSTTDSAPSPMSNHSTLQIAESSDAGISDVAPIVALTGPTSEPAAAQNTLNATVVSELYTAGSFDLFWHFGDSRGALQTGVGSTDSEAHFFRYSATTYAVVVYAADHVGGPATVSWQFLSVENAPPAPAFTGPSGPVYEFSSVTFNASQSLDYVGAPAGAGLSYAWNFGDNSPTVGGSRGAGEVTTHVFTREGTFPVRLTVTDPEGLSASVTHNVTVTDVPILATLSNRTVVVDQFANFSVAPSSGAPTDLAVLNARWNWGDGTNSTGLSSGHTYLAPGVYVQTVTLSSEDGHGLATLTAHVTVLDQPLSVSLPYSGFVVYGENHSVTFRATVLSSAADQGAPPGAFTFLWGFGDGSGNATTTGSLTGSVGHVYSMSGNPVLTVYVTGPNGTYGSASATLTAIPNWDGDGIPDEYAALILHLPVGNDPSHGTGLTDFMSAFVVKGASPPTNANGDGLTAFQDVFGTVTGYVTNPLDPNVAGDGILNSGHQFVDSFTAPKVVQFTGSGSTLIPGVYHPSFLNAASIRSVSLYAEVVSADLANLTLNLTDLGSGTTGTPVTLGGISSPVENWTLLNNTPVGGPMSNYSFSIPEFQANSTWEVTVSGGNGSIQSASILIDYYTNPNLADPFGSGLLLGTDLSTPVFNTSEPLDANYTVFDGKTFTYSTVYYYPYTQEYYKLSVVQGIPYYPWENASYTWNNNSTVSDPHAFATYYGDREFGIGPWQVHAAGDTALTNGMKAYGRVVYDLTANHYLLTTGHQVYGSSFAAPPYPHDSLVYPGPLNPTAFSTGTSGIADSLAINPVGGPEVFGVTITGGWSTCVLEGLTLINPAYGQGVMSNLNVVNATGAPDTMFSGSVEMDDHFYNSGCYMWHFTFNAHYQLPVDTSHATNTIRLGIDFSNAADNAYGGSYDFVVSTNPNAGTQSLYGEDGAGCANFCVSGSVTALPLSRVPVTLVNASGEVHNLPGYGPHWHGDRHFYAIYLNVNDSASGTPFHPGTNVILVSGTAFANSTLNASLGTGNVSSLPFLGSSTFTRRGTSSDLYIVGSLNATLNSSDALQLLAALIPHNGTGNVTGGYEALNQTAFELLGLSGQILQSAPYLPYSTSFYSATSASAPVTFFGEILNVLVEVWDAIVSVAIAIGNFFVNLVAEIGQAIVGAWNAFVSAVEDAVNAIAQAFNFLIQWLNEQFAILNADIKAAMDKVGSAIVGGLVLPMLSLLFNVGILSASQYNSTYANLSVQYNVSDPPTLSSSEARDQIAAILNIVTAVLSAVAVVIGVILYIIGIATVGVGEAAEETVQAAGLVVTFTVQGAVVGALTAGLAGLAGVAGAIFGIASTVSDSALNTFFNSTFGNLLGASISSALQIATGVGFAVMDAILTNAVEGLGGYYISGAVLAVLGVILAGVAGGLAAANESYVAQIVLFVFAIACDVVGGILPFLPQALAIEEASQTVLMGVGISVFAGAAALASIGGLALSIVDFQTYGAG